MPSEGVAIFDCLTNRSYTLSREPLVLAASPDADIQFGSFGNSTARLRLARSGGRVALIFESGNPYVEINGAEFDGGLLPEQIEMSVTIDRVGFFFIRIGADSKRWTSDLDTSGAKTWSLRILDDSATFDAWKDAHCPEGAGELVNKLTMLDLIREIGSRTWHPKIGVVHKSPAQSGFFASQFAKLAGQDQVPDAGDLRCPRCWQRFDTGGILAIDPSLEKSDSILGESERMRFAPDRFGDDLRPLTEEGVPCNSFACPHCRGELPPGFVERAPHMISLVGDASAGKSYFLTVAIRQLKREFPRQLDIKFSDADPAGNKELAKMVTTLFKPTDDPSESWLSKTQLQGATYRPFQRHGEYVSLPQPFTYRLLTPERDAATVVFYDNAGEHFRPEQGEKEKAAATEHLAWSSGILFLFDPLQHRDTLGLIPESKDPQVKRIKKAGVNFDQDRVLAEMSERLRGWRQLSPGAAHEAPLAVVLGKHDLLTEHFPLSSLRMSVVEGGRLSMEAIEANSAATREFLMDYCPDIVGAAESISDQVMYFPASAFGSPAIEHTAGGYGAAAIGPDSASLKPYLVEAPFFWILSQVAPEIFPG